MIAHFHHTLGTKRNRDTFAHTARREHPGNRIQAVVFDWNGTLVDYGCFAPVEALVKTFLSRGIRIRPDEARRALSGMERDPVRAILRSESLCGIPAERDVAGIMTDYESTLMEMLPGYCELVPQALEVTAALRSRKIRIGTTSPFSAPLTGILAWCAGKKGFSPDFVATPAGVPGARPHPWMIYENAMRLGIYPMHSIVKVGDSIQDIHEGINAQCWTVGIIRGGMGLGMLREDIHATPRDILREKIALVRRQLTDAGAHYVVGSLSDLPNVLDEINFRMALGQRPSGKTPHPLSLSA
jgi:phosphonoacetaldehyde hydrolase